MPPQMETIIGPNTSSDAFTFTAIESIQSFVVSDNMGQLQYTGGPAAEGATVTFGQNLVSGLYTLTIYYRSGRMETKKILKTS